MEAGTQPEIATIYPAGEQMQIWQFWDRDNKPQGILSHTLNFAPQIGKKRVYILEQAETLNESAANSLLKVLEEPPPYALFVLLATHPARVLPTIVSRSQVIRLRPSRRGIGRVSAGERRTLNLRRRRCWPRMRKDESGRRCRWRNNARVGEEIGRVLDFAEQMTTSAPCSRAPARRTDAQTGGADQSPRRGRTGGRRGRGRRERQGARGTQAAGSGFRSADRLLPRPAHSGRGREQRLMSSIRIGLPP